MESPIQFLRYSLIALGACLVLAGGVLLLWFGQLVYDIVNAPEKVRIVQFVLEQISVEGPIISGSSTESEFELSLSEPAKTFGFFFLGVFALGVLAGIVKTLVSAGVEIIKGAMAMQPGTESNGNPQSDKRIHPTHKS